MIIDDGNDIMIMTEVSAPVVATMIHVIIIIAEVIISTIVIVVAVLALEKTS